MKFDEARFKRAWRKLCAERGIDPVEGATGYQVTLYNAERRKRMHDRYSSVMTLLHFARHPELIPAGGVGRRTRADWWTKPTYWHNPPDARMSHCFTYVPERVALHSRELPCEYAAVLNVQRQANDAAKSRYVEKVYNHPPQGRRRIRRKFLATGEVQAIAFYGSVRRNEMHGEAREGILTVE